MRKESGKGQKNEPAGAVRTGGSGRFDEIDICRGIGIVLVVLGHALRQTESAALPVRLLISIIYSFHMPLFFCLSGFVAMRILRLASRAERGAFILERARRLLIPYAVMSLLYLPLKLWMNRYAIKPYALSDSWRILIGDSPNTAVWFLYILFLCSAAAVLVVRETNMHLVLAASFLISGSAYALGWQIRFPRYFFFFMLGLWLRANYDSWDEVLQKPHAVIFSAVLFICANAAGWRYGGLWFMLSALTGSHLTLALSRWLSKRGALTGLRRLGLFSMDIYIFSEPVMTATRLGAWNIAHLPAALCMVLCFAAGLWLSLLISRLVIRRVPLLRRLFLGQ